MSERLRMQSQTLFAALLLVTALAANAQEDISVSASEFVHRYEAALATQQWEVVSPLIHENASVIFSNGTAHKGKVAVRAAYERNFAAIKNDTYAMTNVHWLLDTSDTAAYMFDFTWSGVINGQAAQGAGRGTAVLVRENGSWQLLAEHLGPMPPR